MKLCDYCGKENDDALVFCVGCGTLLKTAEEAQIERKPSTLWAQPNWPRMLNGTSATIILVASLAAEFCSVLFVYLLGIIVEAIKGGRTADDLIPVVDKLFPLALIIGLIACGITTIWMSLALIPEAVKDVTPIGAAWVRGRWLAITQGLFVGLILGVIAHFLNMHLKIRMPYRNLDLQERMAYESGLPRMIWVITGVIFAPLFEEILFRGILYGGYRKSLGPIWALILTTTIFALLHLQAFIQYPPAIPEIIALALAALWWRLRSNAIGPAIAVHFAYNSVITFLVLYRI